MTREVDNEIEYAVVATVWVKIWGYSPKDVEKEIKTHSNWDDWSIMEIQSIKKL